jgi:hypothetical protein
MKKRINLWLVMFLAISLALPIYSTAQTKLTLEDSSGNRISTPAIKSFSVGTDNNLVIYLDQPFNFTDFLPDISVDATSGSGCTVSAPASVTATQPAAGTHLPITFKVTSATAGTTFTMPVSPESIASFDSTTKTFSWNIGGSTPVALGSYLAVFEGSSGDNKSQLVVMINITPPGYTLTVNIDGDGTVTKNPEQATYTTNSNTRVQLIPTPASGYSFSRWSGDLSGNANPANIVMNGNKTVTATFAQTPATQYNLTVTIDPSSGGTVALSPTGGSYTANTQVTLTATPNANYTFGSWSGVGSNSGTTASVTMGSADKSVTANFTASGGGGGSAPPACPTCRVYKINKPTAKVNNGFIPENSQDERGIFPVPGGAKIYFEIDPVATAGVSSGFFKLGANFFSGAGTVCKLKLTNGVYSSEQCFGSDGLIDIVPITSNTKYLYAIDNTLGGAGNVFYSIQASIPLF